MIHFDQPDRVQVTCSCGATTTLEFHPELPSRDGDDAGRYTPWNPGWKFRDTRAPDAKTRRLGWYCGEPTHEQAQP